MNHRFALGTVAASLVLVVGRAHGWEPRCYVTSGAVPSVRAQIVELKNYAKCQPDKDLRVGYFRGEHYRLCVDALALFRGNPDAQTLGIMQSALFDSELGSSGQEWKRERLLASSPPSVSDLRAATRHSYCELAELPDSSMSLVDWATGYPDAACTQSPCRNFGALGPMNANHFGDQAGATYNAYHAKAVSVAQQCRANDRLLQAHRRRLGESTVHTEEYLGRCTRIGMIFEGYGLHYLQDRWAVGHMWNRWGSPKPSTFMSKSQAATVSVAAGILHGSEAITGVNDGLSSGDTVAQWGFTTAAVRYRGTGDLHADELMTRAEFKVQRDWLLGCSVAGFTEVTGHPEAISWRARFPTDQCTGGGWATNASMADALDLPVPGAKLTPEDLAGISAVYDTPIKMFLNGMEQINVDVRKLGAELVPVAASVRARAATNPAGLTVARFDLPAFAGIFQGGNYVQDAVSFTALPDVQVPINLGEPLRPGSVEAAITLVASPSACHAQTAAMTKTLIDECQRTRSATSCELCTSMLDDSLAIDGVVASECQAFMGRPGDQRVGLTVPANVCTKADALCSDASSGCRGKPLSAPSSVEGYASFRSERNQLAKRICESGIVPGRVRKDCY